jgi:hypothetical protein
MARERSPLSCCLLKAIQNGAAKHVHTQQVLHTKLLKMKSICVPTGISRACQHIQHSEQHVIQSLPTMFSPKVWFQLPEFPRLSLAMLLKLGCVVWAAATLATDSSSSSAACDNSARTREKFSFTKSM